MEDTLTIQTNTELGAIYCLFCTVFVLLGLLGLAAGSAGAGLAGLVFAAAGAIICLAFCKTVIIGPECITESSAFGSRSIRRSDLAFVCCWEMPTRNGYVKTIWLSTKSISEMAELRRQRLQRSIISRDELPFRTRNPRWQEIFAREALGNNGLGKPWLIYLGKEDDLLAFLKKMYPELPVQFFLRDRAAHTAPGPENESSFSRTPASGGANGALLLLVLAAPIFLVPLILAPAGFGILLLLLATILAPIWIIYHLLPQRESDRMEPLPEGLRVVRKGQTLAEFAPEQVSLIARCDTAFGSCIAVSAVPLEEMLSAQTKQIRKYTWVRNTCQPALALPDWKLRLARAYMASTVILGCGRRKEIQIMSWSPNRWERLKKACPRTPTLDMEPWENNTPL